jgi:long-chain fatty acid transport protein
MLSIRIIIVVICVFSLSFFSQKAFAAASGGYSIEVPDAGAFGMGNAFVGQADTPAAVYYNPAGITQMSRPEVSVGEAILAPRGQMTQPDGNTVHMQNNEYGVPNFYAVVPVIPNKLSIGAGGGSYFGLGTNWGPNSPLRYATTQANITDVDNSLVVSYQVTKQWSIAASADNDYSRADLSRVLYDPIGYTPTMEVKGGDDAWGYRLATMFKINDQNQVGLMYRSRIDHNYKGKISINGMSPFYDAHYGFSGPSFVTNFEEKSVLPQVVVLGYSFKPTTKWTINADLKWSDWSQNKYETLTYSNTTLSNLLGSNNRIPEDWHSEWAESIGAQYAVTDRFRLRLGYYHGGAAAVVPDADFNPSLPDSNCNGIATGFGFDITKRLTLDVAYSANFYTTRDIINTVSNPYGSVDGKYEQIVHMGLVSLTYKF